MNSGSLCYSRSGKLELHGKVGTRLVFYGDRAQLGKLEHGWNRSMKSLRNLATAVDRAIFKKFDRSPFAVTAGILSNLQAITQTG